LRDRGNEAHLKNENISVLLGSLEEEPPRLLEKTSHVFVEIDDGDVDSLGDLMLDSSERERPLGKICEE